MEQMAPLSPTIEVYNPRSIFLIVQNDQIRKGIIDRLNEYGLKLQIYTGKHYMDVISQYTQHGGADVVILSGMTENESELERNLRELRESLKFIENNPTRRPTYTVVVVPRQTELFPEQYLQGLHADTTLNSDQELFDYIESCKFFADYTGNPDAQHGRKVDERMAARILEELQRKNGQTGEECLEDKVK